MKFQIDQDFLIDCFRDSVEVPSPVGYDLQLRPVLERYAAMFGQTLPQAEGRVLHELLR